MDTVNFSIVIPTWKRSALVKTLLQSLYEDRKNYHYGKTEVIVIDNSEGGERAVIEKACTDFDVRYIEGTASVRQKRNRGIDEAIYEYILFIDSDVTLRAGLLDEHARTFLDNQENKRLAGSFGLTEFVGDKSFWWKILEQTTFIDSFSFASRYPYVSWTIGNNVAFRKDVLLEIGKFEENLPFKLGGDDLDMTYRVTKAGYLIKSTPEAVTYHSRETWNNFKAVNDRSKRWGSMEYYILKRHPELVHRRLPKAGDYVTAMTLLFGASAIIKQSFCPVCFWALWCVIYCIMLFGFRVKEEGWVNPFYWLIAKALEGKYRFHRLMISLKNHDLSLAFKGQYFGIYHIKSDFQLSARKTWLYFESVFVILVIMILYGMLHV